MMLFAHQMVYLQQLPAGVKFLFYVKWANDPASHAVSPSAGRMYYFMWQVRWLHLYR